MIINDRIRNMSDSEKMKYFLDKLTDDMPRIKKNEVIEQISKLSKGIEPSDFLEHFNLKGEYKAGENGRIDILDLSSGHGFIKVHRLNICKDVESIDLL